MRREINPKDTTRASAYELWMKAPNPMVTFFKTLDVTNLIKVSKRKHLKFNMLLDYCIGKAAVSIKEFYILPIGDKLIQYDTIADSKYHWKALGWKIREMRGMKEKITSGASLDTLIQMEPMDLVFSKGQQETFTSPQLKEYISKQIDRGSKNIVQYEVEYHKRIASSFASFILTTIGVSLSSRKRKGGMGMYLGIGLALSFTYIMLQTISATFAIHVGAPAALAAWMPNIIFTVIAFFCYKHAPR